MVSPYEVSQKLVISGQFVEHYQYEQPYIKGMPQFKPFRLRVSKRKDLSTQEALREDNVRRTRTRIRRLVNSNHQLDRFMTLTFAENVKSLSEANACFYLFVKRLRYLYPGFEYLCVPEFQKRGAVHYHLLCNTPFIPRNELEKIWGFGYVFLRKIDKIDNLGAYICKYLGKDNFDERLFRKKKFFYSVSLMKPLILDKLEDIKEALLLIPEFFWEKVRHFVFLTDFLGVVKYKQIKVFDSYPLFNSVSYG